MKHTVLKEMLRGYRSPLNSSTTCKSWPLFQGGWGMGDGGWGMGDGGGGGAGVGAVAVPMARN